MSTRPHAIVITGASSGIGEALARHYAQPGTRLGLLGRNEEQLVASAEACRRQGAEVAHAEIDVRDRTAMAAWLTHFDAETPIDLLIANAGVMHGTPLSGEIETPDGGYSTIEINVLGVLNTVQPLLSRMMERRAGQIALVSSLAGFLPLRDAPSYSASKYAVIGYGLSLRDLLWPYGIKVSVVCPGYVKTPLLDQETGEKPGEMPASRAAAIIARGLERNKGTIAFPFWLALGTRLVGLLPDRLRERRLRNARFQVKSLFD
jgi:short-subunit dehydrogenase